MQSSKQHQPSGTATSKGKSKAGRQFREKNSPGFPTTLYFWSTQNHIYTLQKYKQHYVTHTTFPLPLPLISSSVCVTVLHSVHNADVLLSVQCLWIMNIGFSLASEVENGREARQQSLFVFVFKHNLCLLDTVCSKEQTLSHSPVLNTHGWGWGCGWSVISAL